MRRSWAVIAVMLLLATSCSWLPAPPEPTARPQLEELREKHEISDCPESDPAAEGGSGRLPQIELPCLGSDEMVNLAGLPEGAKVINFWAQWCEPCREESPFLREAHEQRPGVQFIGINYDDPDPALAIEFAGLAGLTYPHVRDRHKQLQVLGVPGLPLTLFVGDNGDISHSFIGGIESTEQLLELMDEHLGEK